MCAAAFRRKPSPAALNCRCFAGSRLLTAEWNLLLMESHRVMWRFMTTHQPEARGPTSQSSQSSQLHRQKCLLKFEFLFGKSVKTLQNSEFTSD